MKIAITAAIVLAACVLGFTQDTAGGAKGQLPNGIDLNGNNSGLHLEFLLNGEVLVTGEVKMRNDDAVQIKPTVLEYEMRHGPKGPKACFESDLEVDPEQSPQYSGLEINLNFYGSVRDMENHDEDPDDDVGGSLKVSAARLPVYI